MNLEVAFVGFDLTCGLRFELESYIMGFVFMRLLGRWLNVLIL